MRANINNIECIFYIDERISQNKAPEGYPFMYHIRHDEDNWTLPISIERCVWVNFFGTVFMKKPLNFSENYYLEIESFFIEDKQFITFCLSDKGFEYIFRLA
jgi:hypothetical protein